jgi:hypothetical protein
MELEYVHTADGVDGLENLITSDEGKAVVNEGMKLLGVEDLSEEELPMRLLRA